MSVDRVAIGMTKCHQQRAPTRPSTAGDRATRKVPCAFHVKRGDMSRLVLCGAETPCLGLAPG